MLGMGIWVGSQGLLAKAITLLVFAGFWAIMHGIGDFIRAFQLKKLGSARRGQDRRLIDRGAARYPSLAPQPGWVHPAGLLAVRRRTQDWSARASWADPGPPGMIAR